MFLYRMRIGTRLALAGAAIVLGLVLIAGIAAASTRRDAVAAHRDRIRNLVEIATGIVGSYQKAEAENRLSHEEAQRLAKEALRDPRYGQNDYYFLCDFDGRALMMPGNPALEGSLMRGKADAQGFRFWDRFVEIANSTGSGYVEYWFPRAGQTTAKPKLSYVAAIPGWNWIVGTGVYVDDVDNAVSATILQYALISLLILAVATGIAWLVSRSIVTQLGGEPHDAAESMRRIANGNFSVDIPLHDGDEHSLMASLKLMQMKLTNLTRSIHEGAAALADQVSAFDGATQLYVAIRSDEHLADVSRSVKRLGRTADLLKKSIARFRL